MSATGRQPSFVCSLLSGAVAGPSVDIALYPLDTIKTRLQSAEGFIRSGGFKGVHTLSLTASLCLSPSVSAKGVYAGLGAGAIGSAPGSMFFFSTYEGVKKVMGSRCAVHHPRSKAAHLLPVLSQVELTTGAAAQWRDTDRPHRRGLLRRSDGLHRARSYRKRQTEAAGRHSFINDRLCESDHQGGWCGRLLSRMCAAALLSTSCSPVTAALQSGRRCT